MSFSGLGEGKTKGAPLEQDLIASVVPCISHSFLNTLALASARSRKDLSGKNLDVTTNMTSQLVLRRKNHEPKTDKFGVHASGVDVATNFLPGSPIY